MVQVFVNTAHVTNLLGAAIAYLKWGNNIVIHDLQAMDEAAITAAIAAMAATQEAILVFAVPVAAYNAAGDITDAQVTALDAKILATSQAPFDTTYVFELVKTNCISAWDACFPDLTYNHPMIVRYLTRSGVQGYVEKSGIAGVITTNATNTLITEAGAFAGLSLVGMYACFIGAKGIHVEKIISHTDNALTLAKLDEAINPASWEVVANPEEAFMSQYVEIGMKALNHWGITKADMDTWARMLDLAFVDKTQGDPYVAGRGYGPVQDLQFVKELKEIGKKLYAFAYWNTKHPMAWY